MFCYRLLFVLLSFILFTRCLDAQYLKVPYFCGFEDELENKEWELNTCRPEVESKIKNKWYVSTKERFSGKHSLLISDINAYPDTSAYYSSEGINIVASRSITLPKGDYLLSFAWKAQGKSRITSVNEPIDRMYVAWIEDDEDIDVRVGLPHYWATDQSSEPFAGKAFNENIEWKTETVEITSYGRPMKLAFLWVNSGKSDGFLSACIDDIQIAKKACGHVSDVRYEAQNDGVLVSWDDSGNSSEYEVQVFSSYGNYLQIFKNIKQKELYVPDLPLGTFDFYIRAICNGDTTIWYNLRNVVVNHSLCIDYANLTGKNVKCLAGVLESGKTGIVGIEKDPVVPPIDHGEDNMASRHTICTRPGVYDPRTGGVLPTIPQDEPASVRLGNWNWNSGERQSVVYDIDIAPNSNIILLVKHAVVLEHDQTANDVADLGSINIEILNERGIPVNGKCGAVTIRPDKRPDDRHWHLSSVSNMSKPIYFKEWSTVGLDLSGYVNSGMPTALKVRITTSGNANHSHYCYAYFTISCIEKELYSELCSGDEDASVAAPDGFGYEWHLPETPDDILCDKREMELSLLENDVDRCFCRLKSKDNNSSVCEIELPVSIQRIKLTPAFTVDWRPRDCKNGVLLRNTTIVTGAEKNKPDNTEWLVDGKTYKQQDLLLENLDSKGGPLHIVQMVGKGNCMETLDTVIILPEIKPAYICDTIEVCSADDHRLNRIENYQGPGDYVLTKPEHKTVAGCDSTYTLHVVEREELRIEMDTTICKGESVVCGGQKWSSQGKHTVRVSVPDGCDTVYTVNITVKEIMFNATVIPPVGDSGFGGLLVEGIDLVSQCIYSIDGVSDAQLDSISVGKHILIVTDTVGGIYCDSEPYEFEIEIEPIRFSLNEVPDICSGDLAFVIPVTIESGIISSYDIMFDDKALSAGFVNQKNLIFDMDDPVIEVWLPAEVRPDYYTMTLIFRNVIGDTTVVHPFCVLYPADIIRQKWNDVLAVEKNDDYTFSAFAWCYNDAVLFGEDKPYLYVGETGRKLNPEGEYRVLLTRADDGVAVKSCPVIPIEKKDINEYPQSPANVQGISTKAEVPDMRQICGVEIYDLNGVCWYRGTLTESGPDIEMPSVGGLYVVRMICDGGQIVKKIMVVRK